MWSNSFVRMLTAAHEVQVQASSSGHPTFPMFNSRRYRKRGMAWKRGKASINFKFNLIHYDCEQLTITGEQKFIIIVIVQNLMIATGMYVLYHLYYRESTY